MRACRIVVLTLLVGLVGLCLAGDLWAQAPPAPAPAAPVPAGAPAPAPPKIDTGDTAWVLMSSALVLLMTAPGLALFYGGMVRQKNALGTLMHSFIILALISVQWVLWGYTLAFGPTGAASSAASSGSGSGESASSRSRTTRRPSPTWRSCSSR